MHQNNVNLGSFSVVAFDRERCTVAFSRNAATKSEEEEAVQTTPRRTVSSPDLFTSDFKQVFRVQNNCRLGDNNHVYIALFHLRKNSPISYYLEKPKSWPISLPLGLSVTSSPCAKMRFVDLKRANICGQQQNEWSYFFYFFAKIL